MSLDFMNMVSDIHQRRYSRQIQQLIGAKVPCGFFCGFNIPANITEIVKSVKNFGINLTYIIVPVDKAKEIFESFALPVLTLAELPKSNVKTNQIIYVGARIEESFTEYFKRYGINTLKLEDVGGKENSFNFYMQHLADLYSAYEMLGDEESKAVYRAYLTGKLTGYISDYKFAPESQYFLEGFLPVEGDIAIDGGAFDGATARDFSMQGAKVYAFEMSAQNYKNCLERAEKYNFVIENIGLSNREGVEHYTGGGAGAHKGGGYGDRKIH